MSKRHFLNPFSDGTLELTDLNKEELANKAFEISISCCKNQPPIHKYHGGGLYVGFSGHIYCLLHLSKCPLLSSQRQPMLEKAKYLVAQDLINYDNRSMGNDIRLSFLVGRLGLLAVAACVYDQLNILEEAKSFIKEFTKLGEEFLKRGGSDELFVGRSGYVAALFCIKSYVKQTTINFPQDLLYNILNTIVQSGQHYSQKHGSKCPLMYAYHGREYLGAGHGLVGILMALMSSREYLQENSVVTSIIQDCINYLIENTSSNGNLEPAVDELGSVRSEDNQLVHWCHGAAGAVYVYARAYVLWKDEKYLKSALKCGEVVWKYGLLKKGPGICHGVAGGGYVFLLLYRLTSDSKHLYRAHCFYEFLWSPDFKSGARTPDSPFSLFEGWAGTACFIADLANPNMAYFPFFDAFQ